MVRSQQFCIEPAFHEVMRLKSAMNGADTWYVYGFCGWQRDRGRHARSHMHQINLLSLQNAAQTPPRTRPAERILAANRQDIMFGTNPLQMSDHRATFRHHDGTSTGINDGLCHFQSTTLNTTAHKRWQYLGNHRCFLVTAMRFYKRLDLVARVH